MEVHVECSSAEVHVEVEGGVEGRREGYNPDIAGKYR